MYDMLKLLMDKRIERYAVRMEGQRLICDLRIRKQDHTISVNTRRAERRHVELVFEASLERLLYSRRRLT